MTERFTIYHAPDSEPFDLEAGEWTEWGNVWVCCPGCESAATLANHEVDPTGDVNPSLDCYNSECDFHEFVTLDGWQSSDE